MSVTESSSESEGLIASRTRSRNVGPTREINESSSSNISLSLSNLYLETEFLAFPGPLAMENKGAHAFSPDLIELLQEITDRLHAHEQHIEGAPRARGHQEQGTSSPQYFAVLPLMIFTNGYKNFNGIPFLTGGPLNNI